MFLLDPVLTIETEKCFCVFDHMHLDTPLITEAAFTRNTFIFYYVWHIPVFPPFYLITGKSYMKVITFLSPFTSVFTFEPLANCRVSIRTVFHSTLKILQVLFTDILWV